MRPTRNIALLLTLSLLLPAFAGAVRAADPADQVVSNYADILKANPMPAGDKAQQIKIGDGPTATVSLMRFAPGAGVKNHIHKTHTETLYIIEGGGQMTVDGKATDFGPGAVIHVPIGKAHAVKTGDREMVAVQIFAPRWTEPADRVFVP